MEWVKPNLKIQPNTLAIMGAVCGKDKIEEATRLKSVGKEWMRALVIGNNTLLPVGAGELGLDIGSFNLWIKRCCPNVRYEKIRNKITLDEVTAKRCVVWTKNFAVYVEDGKYYSFRNLDGAKVFAIWYLEESERDV